METEEARRLWGRSTQHHFRYITFVGVSDSSAYKAVCSMNEGRGLYEDVSVAKEEYVNHISKRMGARLRNTKKEASIQVQTKMGKVINRSILGSQGKLTDDVINTLQSYFGKAIRDNVGQDVKTLK